MTDTKLNPRFEAVLFDLDGTLIDTAPDFIEAVNLQRTMHSLPPLAPKSIRRTVSDGARALVQLSFGISDGDSRFNDRLEQLLTIYVENVAGKSALFEGMDQVLMSLEAQSVPWGIVTNKPRRFTSPLLQALKLDQRSSVSVCPDDVKQRKPHPESLHLACRKLDAAPSNCLYVGDHARDIEAGKNAGMMTVAAAYGYIEHRKIALQWQADWMINQPSELISVIFD